MAEFFDKMLVMINQGAESISEGSKTIVEKAKISTALHNAEERKKKAAELLGLQMYKLHMSGLAMPEELLSYCMEIENLCHEIEGYHQTLISLNSQKKANKSAPNQNVRSEYSDVVDVDIQESEASVQDVLVCNNCGAVNRNDALFCFNCGNKIISDDE